MGKLQYKAVLFDLLTALLDSWSLWNAVAGSAEDGRRWRGEYLRISYGTGAYRPYTDLVAEAAEVSGLPRGLALELEARYSDLQPWDDTRSTLLALAAAGVPIGVVTNCSEKLGRIAVDRLGVELSVMVTAERAGFYKPDPQPYRLALEELGVDASQCLFVAGSAYDLVGTEKVGMPAYWHDRIGMVVPESVPAPMAKEATLGPLLGFFPAL